MTSLPKPEYHYKVINFCPRTDIPMGGWPLAIELDPDYARKLVQHKIDPEHFKRLTEMAEAAQKAVFASMYGDDEERKALFDYPRRRTYQFWDDTCLLTNMTVEPGNACGLDMEFGTFEQIKKGTYSDYRGVMYYPHNVDSIYQASALLACFTIWYDHVEAMLQP